MSEGLEETQYIKPVVSSIMPGYNEEEIVGYRLVDFFPLSKKLGTSLPY